MGDTVLTGLSRQSLWTGAETSGCLNPSCSGTEKRFPADRRGEVPQGIEFK